MRITALDIPQEECHNGLEGIKMNRLGDLILLAGENGAGKTRILQTVQHFMQYKLTKKEVSNIKKQIEELQREKNTKEEYIKELDKLNPDGKSNVKKDFEIDVERCKEQINLYETQINQKNIITDNLGERQEYNIVSYVPPNQELTNPYDMSKNMIQQRAMSVKRIGMDTMGDSALATIQFLQDQWFEATHQYSKAKDDLKTKCIKDYEAIKELIESFFPTILDRQHSNATLYDMPLGNIVLSTGQRILLQFCVAVHSQGSNIQNTILFMDEPENHLHPKVIIEIIDSIRKHVTNGQIWIATHSIPLLAHFDPKYLWYVEKGKVSWAGNSPETVLNALVGDESEMGRLQDFIGLPAQFAVNNYAYDCLFEPKALMTGAADPQTIQIKDGLKYLMKGGKIKVLDYGAGKGRLLANIMENVKEDKEGFLKSFDYTAFDKYDNDKEDCCSIISEHYSSADKRYYNNYKSLFSDYNENEFDVVVMCNVLHEIDPNEWLTVFGPDGWITKMLSNDGIVLLVEDQQIPTGEKAYQKGFIVLDTPQVRQLFQVTAADTAFSVDSRNAGRLKAHFIPKACIERITADTKVKALESLRKIASEEIKEIRKKDKTYANGKIHGFWVQQFANTQLALGELV